MTQAEIAPPTFVIFCNRSDFVTRAYEGFLRNRIREDLELPGIPVRIVWRERGAAFQKKEKTSSKAEMAREEHALEGERGSKPPSSRSERRKAALEKK